MKCQMVKRCWIWPLRLSSSNNSAGPGSVFVRVVGYISSLSGWISAGMVVAAVAITCQMIYVRSVQNLSTVWQTEAVVYLVVAATLLGLPYVQLLRGHVNVDLVPLYLPMPLRKALHVFTLGLSLLIIAVMVYYGYDYWHVAFERNWKSPTWLCQSVLGCCFYNLLLIL